MRPLHSYAPVLHWLPVVLYLLSVSSPALASSPHESATPASSTSRGQWVLPWGCLSRCPTYSHGSAIFTSALFSSQPVPAGGELQLGPGESSVEWHESGQASTLTFRGPCAIRLNSDGTYLPSCDGEARKKGHAKGSGIASGTFRAGSINTRYRVVYSSAGALCLEVKCGKVKVWDVAQKGEAQVIARGQGVYFPAPEEILHLKGRPQFEVLADSALEQRCSDLRTAIRAVQSKSDGTAREALSAFSRALPMHSADEAALLALKLAERYADSPEAPRALYLAWLKAQSNENSGLMAQLLDALTSRYPDAYWTSMATQAASETHIGNAP